MPTVSRFLGLMIKMFFNDHEPPHIHVQEKGEGETRFNFRGEVTKREGKHLSSSKETIVKAWILLRQSELMENWRLARKREPLNKIEPLS